MYENIVNSLRHCAENDCSPECPRAGIGKGCISGLKREAAEAIARIRTYEETQKIHVGDEVKRNQSEINMLSRHEKYVCLKYADETGNYTLVNRYGNIYTVKRKDIVKTGRHFPEVAALLDKMKGDTPDV